MFILPIKEGPCLTPRSIIQHRPDAWARLIVGFTIKGRIAGMAHNRQSRTRSGRRSAERPEGMGGRFADNSHYTQKACRIMTNSTFAGICSIEVSSRHDGGA